MRLPDRVERRLSKARAAGLETSARRASRAASRVLYPLGKALARIVQGEIERGLPVTHAERGGGGVISPRLARSVRPTRAASATPPAKVRQGFYADAVAHRRSLASPPPGTPALPAWTELGPRSIPHGQTYGSGGNASPPVSGRCVGIYLDPADARHLVLASAGGGLWASDDAGSTWTPLTDGQPTLSMGALVAAPRTPEIVYAATGEGDTFSRLGIGLLRSTDSGRTWSALEVPVLAGQGIYDLAVHPTDAQHLWIAAVEGLYESLDGGVTVRRVHADKTWSVSVRSDGAEIMVGCTSGLRVSTDGGATWTAVNLSGLAQLGLTRLEVAHAPSKPAVVYVAAACVDAQGRGVARLWRRATGTGGFTSQSVPIDMDVSQGWYDWCFAVAPDDPDLVYWGAIELYRGRRSGGSLAWSNISSRSAGDSIHPDQHHLTFAPGDPATLYVCNDGGLFRSPDRGNAWQALNSGLGITEFEYLAQLESDPAWILGGTQDNGTLAHKGARLWDQVALGDGGDCAAIDGAAPICYHSYYGIWIERARAKPPNAFRWSNVSPTNDAAYPALFYPPMDARGVLLTKAGATVFVSAKSGDLWTEVLLPTSQHARPDLASALVIVGAREILVGTVAGRLYRLLSPDDAWSTAQVQTLTRPRAGYVSDLVPMSGATLWSAISSLGGGHVFRSRDGGTTWEDRSGNLPDIPVSAIVVDPLNPDTLFAATDHGVYRTLDAGGTWADISGGLPNVVVGDLLLHEGARRLRAGTRSRGVWELQL